MVILSQNLKGRKTKKKVGIHAILEKTSTLIKSLDKDILFKNLFVTVYKRFFYFFIFFYFLSKKKKKNLQKTSTPIKSLDINGTTTTPCTKCILF